MPARKHDDSAEHRIENQCVPASQRYCRTVFVLRAIVPVAALLTLSFAWAQYQVKMNADRRVNTGIYAGPNTGSMRYASQNPVSNPLLTSQVRHQEYMSGMMRSEIRMGTTQVGPMAPGGVMSFLPSGTPLSRAQGTPPPAPTGPAGSTGSMRYSHPTAQTSPDLRIGAPVATSQGNATPRSLTAISPWATPISDMVKPQQVTGSLVYPSGPYNN